MPKVYASVQDLHAALDQETPAAHIDDLVYTSTFSEDAQARDQARQWIRQTAREAGCGPASIQSLYDAMGRGEVDGVTVPAINIRGATYDVARAVFRAGKRLSVGPILLEIARSEIGYTRQRPAEYAAGVLAAAIKEQWPHPVLIQGDHFQIKAKEYHADAAAAVDGVKSLIDEAIPAGFYNIDIDTSTLVDLDQPTLHEQQRLNYEVGVELNRYVRACQPEGVEVTVGGEIGEVGGKNSTPDELVAYMEGYLAALPEGMRGIGKISVQTGTAHGGVVLPDGSIKEVAVDIDTLDQLGKLARERYGLGGAVQHGASTLPEELFDRFPRSNTCEIHLATGFQNIMYAHLPGQLRQDIDAWLRDNLSQERKSDQTDEQFIYKTRKKGFGPFKYEFWHLPEDVKSPMYAELEAKFETLFTKLGVKDTASLADRYLRA